MAAPILWTPGKNASLLQENHVHKIPRFRGGGVFWVLGGGECRFNFYGRADFSEKGLNHRSQSELRTEKVGMEVKFCRIGYADTVSLAGNDPLLLSLLKSVSSPS